MGPERDGQDVWFSATEASRILGVTRQAIYMAITAGQLKEARPGSNRRIHAKDLIAYGIQTGRDPKDLVDRIQEDTGADAGDLVTWVLAGLGLFLLVKGLFGKK